MSIPLIPFEKFTIVCGRAKNEVLRSLQDNIANNRNPGDLVDHMISTRHMPFAGRLTNNHFIIYKKGRDSFKPRLEGNIRDAGATSLIEITAQPGTLIMIIFGLMYGGLIFGLIAAAFGDEDTMTTAKLGAIIVGSYIVWLWWFFSALKYAKRNLLEVVGGKISNVS